MKDFSNNINSWERKLDFPDIPSQEKLYEETLAREKWACEIEKPIKEELRDIGIKVNWLADLLMTSESYFEAYPIILKHLEHSEYPGIRETMMRALLSKDSKGLGVDLFVKEFRWAAEDKLKDSITNNWNHMDVAVRAMKIAVIKGEAEKIKPLFVVLENANIPQPVKDGIRKDLNKVYKLAGGK